MSSKNLYSGYILLSSGILCLLIDCKEDTDKETKKMIKRSASDADTSVSTGDIKVDSDRSIDLESNRKKEANPYNYPEDF